MVPNDWWEFSIVARKKIDGIERMGYPTEKPETLLERPYLNESSRRHRILETSYLTVLWGLARHRPLQ